MPVNSAKRVEVAAALAAVMRGETRRDEIESLRQRLFPDGWPGDDMLALHAITRLEKHWAGGVLRRSSQWRVTPHQWEKLRRWIAILNTDLDWDDTAYAPVAQSRAWGDWIGCGTMLLTLAALVGASQIADGQPLLIWMAIGLIVSPACMIYLVRQSFSERAPKPFASFEQMSQLIDRADSYDLPAYDRSRHGPPLIDRFEHWLSCAIKLLLLAAAFIAVWPAMLIILWLERHAPRD